MDTLAAHVHVPYRGVRDIACRHLVWRDLVGPCRVLEHHPIPIEILERLPLHLPIRIIRRDTLEPRSEHASTTGCPLVLVGQVKDQQMILRRRCADVMATLGRELQMVGLLGMSEDDAIEAVMDDAQGMGGRS